MAVQFRCGACGEEIEVDQELAGQRVTCPFCREEVSAPRESAVGGDAGPPLAEEDLDLTKPPVPRGNAFSWISLGCMVVAAVCLGTFSRGFYLIQNSVDENLEALKLNQVDAPADEETRDERAETQQRTKLVNEGVRKRPGLLLIGGLGMCVVPVLGIVAGIIALVRVRLPRWPAVVALICFGLYLALAALSTVLKAAMGAKPGIDSAAASSKYPLGGDVNQS